MITMAVKVPETLAHLHDWSVQMPLVIAISTTLGVRSGLLVRDRRGLEEARFLTTVVFDKTGTLTCGEFRVVDIATDGSLDANEALRLAAAVERDSEHTIAQGIVKSAEEQKLSLAAGVLAAQGILLAPAFAAVLMSASTVIVALNAQLLRRAEL